MESKSVRDPESILLINSTTRLITNPMFPGSSSSIGEIHQTVTGLDPTANYALTGYYKVTSLDIPSDAVDWSIVATFANIDYTIAKPTEMSENWIFFRRYVSAPTESTAASLYLTVQSSSGVQMTVAWDQIELFVSTAD